MPPIIKKVSEKNTAVKKTATVKSTKTSETKLKKDKSVALKNTKTVAKTKETKSPKIDKTVKNSKTKTVADKVKKDAKSEKVVKNKEKISTVKVDSKKTVDKKVTPKSSNLTKKSEKKIATIAKSIKKQSTTDTKIATPKTVIDLPIKEKKIASKSVEADVKVKKPKKVKENNVDFIIATTLGNIDIRLFPDKAPITVSNFLRYISADYYSNTVFHRIIRGFMIQGGGYDQTLSFREDTLLPIKIESNNGLKNLRGTIAMARTSDPHSATSQFFINLTDNSHLDFSEETIEKYGYTVFAKVTRGLDIVDKIGNSPITTVYHHQNVPATPIIIKSITNKVK